MHLLYTKLYFILEKSVPNLLRRIRHKKVTADLGENPTDVFCFGCSGGDNERKRKQKQGILLGGR